MPEQPLGPGDRVIVAGASGLIGRALVTSLRSRGAEVQRLVRRPAVRTDELTWDPRDGLDPELIRGARAIVVLNGASIGRLPWTRAYRSDLLWSRLAPVRAVAAAVEALGSAAPHLVHASAVGFYGSRPGADLDESAPAGTGFLADLCVAVESAARTVADVAPVTSLRIAPVLHADGVLKPLMILTRLGSSGPLGAGTQTWPWTSLPDVVAAVEHVIEQVVTGPVNVTAPERTTANDIGFGLAVRMNRPFVVRAPAWALRLVLGEAADGLLLSDARVIPERLADTGFSWEHPSVDDAIRAALPAA